MKAINVQHLNVKLFARQAEIDLADAIPVFHRWIQQGLRDELLVDVADYSHVPDGPGVLLIGHEANYSLDEEEGRLGLLYNRKSVLEGDTRSKLAQAFRAALEACRTLEQEEPFAGRLRFGAEACEVIVNDRLLAPNDDATWAALKPELEAFLATIYGAGNVRVERRGEPRERFRVAVTASAPVEVGSLLEALAAPRS